MLYSYYNYFAQNLSQLVALLFLFSHAIYISVIEVNIHQQSTKGTIDVKVFSDDLLSALKAEHNEIIFDIDLVESYSKQISTYLDSHLSLSLNAQQIPLRLNSIQKENDTHWLKFEFEATKDFSQIKFETDLLTEIFNTQSNIVSISVDDQKEYYRLSKSSTSCQFELNNQP